MADYTLAEATALLAKVNIAIESKITNKRFAGFRVGTVEYNREYTFDTTTMQELLDLRKELLDIINALSPPAAPIFKSNAIFGIVARKGTL